MRDFTRGQLPHHRLSIPTAVDRRTWLVMVHGASRHSGLFSAQVAWFSERYCLLLIDLPGHGAASDTPGPYGLDEYARSVQAALDQAGVTEAHYWGTHTGAGVGLLLAARDERRLKSLVLEGAILPGLDMPYVTATVGRARTTAGTRGIAAARQEWFAGARWFDAIRRNPEQCRAREHWSLISAFGGAPWTNASVPRPVEPVIEKLGDVTIPTLLVNGEHELTDFVWVADQLEARLPRVQRIIIPAAGGFPLWEYPDLVNARVEEFLRGQKA